jgi:hypothetical protein
MCWKHVIRKQQIKQEDFELQEVPHKLPAHLRRVPYFIGLTHV